jgi:heme-degrading monooxygenase HmoA
VEFSKEGELIVAMFRAPVEPGREKEFEEGFAHRARAVDQMPGFAGLDVLRHVDGKGYVVMTRWESRDAYEAWLRSPAFARGHGGQPHDPAQSQPLVDIYEVVPL